MFRILSHGGFFHLGQTTSEYSKVGFTSTQIEQEDHVWRELILLKPLQGPWQICSPKQNWCLCCHGNAMSTFSVNLAIWTDEGRLTFISPYLQLQMVLERYFSMAGQGAELVLPKQLQLQEKLRRGPPKDADFFSEDFDG